ncbi:STAS domain-containing protein [Streptomyces minutiscleroticus]|uniref:STAS domain-containing protein n=1 Tax=Streptomyces minutiscleroticus TaxID=68238 RepID=UPI00167F0E0E|nr:STAS domain-containing protein [Streptomyces minutiscleroticus]
MIIRTVVGGATVLRLLGTLDVHTTGRLRQVLTVDRRQDPVRVVLDCRWVGFLDSSDVNALVRLHCAARAASGWVRLVRVQPAVQRVIRLSGLEAVIDCYPTLEQVLHS